MRLVATEYLSLAGVFEEPGHWSHPWFVRGKGVPLFAQETDREILGVPETKTFTSGVVVLEYRPKGEN